ASQAAVNIEDPGVLVAGDGGYCCCDGDGDDGDFPKRVRMYSRALSGGSFTVPGPLRTKTSPSGAVSSPFHFRKTGSGLRWQVTMQTVFPSTIWVLGSMHVPARSPRPFRTTCARWRMNLSSLSS